MKPIKSKLLTFSIFFLTLGFIWNCANNDEGGVPTNNFDRNALLTHWADHIILPAYTSFQAHMTELKSTSDLFLNTPSEEALQTLRLKWKETYMSWQNIAMFQFGPAEESLLRQRMNIYPAQITTIESNIESGIYDLSASSSHDEIGFPAIDYLINGLSKVSDTEIVAFYTTHTNASKYKSYLSDVVQYMETITNEVVGKWSTNYRDEFVNNNSASSTGSFNVVVDRYISYYETYLRTGKIAIPAGVFATEPLPTKVEAFYKGDLSKQLFQTSLLAVQKFFNGKNFNNNSTGESLKSYLDFLNTLKNGEDLSSLINNQFDVIRTSANVLNSNFATQIETNNALMLATYDELQTNLVLLKVDMVSALDIILITNDNDGD